MTKHTEQTDSAATLLRPIQIKSLNVIGITTLYQKEVQRFMKVAMQALCAPVVTAMLFMMVFSGALGDRAALHPLDRGQRQRRQQPDDHHHHHDHKFVVMCTIVRMPVMSTTIASPL